jgi:hypothetical protein
MKTHFRLSNIFNMIGTEIRMLLKFRNSLHYATGILKRQMPYTSYEYVYQRNMPKQIV